MQVNPKGKWRGRFRVLRGGIFKEWGLMGSACRHGYSSYLHIIDAGFRIIMGVPNGHQSDK